MEWISDALCVVECVWKASLTRCLFYMQFFHAFLSRSLVAAATEIFSHHVTSRCAFPAVCNCLLSYVTIKHVVFFLLSTALSQYTQAFCVFGGLQNFCVEFCTTELASSFPFGLFFVRVGGAYLKAQAANAAWSGDTTATTFCFNLKLALNFRFANFAFELLNLVNFAARF